MDMKDMILVGGGLLIVAVIIHGLWIAWRARRDPLRMDLVTDLPLDPVDERARNNPELPNGGARVIRRDEASPEQGDLLRGQVDEVAEPPRARRPADERRSDGEARPRGARTEPRLRTGAETGPAEAAPAPAPEIIAASPIRATSVDQAESGVGRPRVADVIMPERSGGKSQRRESQRGTPAADVGESLPAEGAAPRQAAKPVNKLAERPAVRADSRPAERALSKNRLAAPEARKPEPVVEELIIINLVAQRNNPFVGPSLVEALRSRGLRYGDMNIFHRLDPTSRASLYSVANVVEPGIFDIADLEGFRSPGICFFMQLPGPEHPMEVFEDMLKAAREVASRIGGELKDERRSVLTGQTVEHYRQRISDFCRRRMSMRA